MPECKISVLEILEKSRGYNTAFLTTFNFEIDFFEKAILSRLLKNSIKKVSVFVDSKELAKSVSGIRNTLMGQRYVVNPVAMRGSYHPKMILLLGEDRARLIVGSGNLKTSGYYINNEVFDCIDYDSDHPLNRELMVHAIKFLMSSNSLTPGLDTGLLKEAEKRNYFRPADMCDDIRLIENTSLPILAQVRNAIGEFVRSVTIAVPYYDNGLEGLSAVQKTFPEASIELYLQREKSTYPANSPKQELHPRVRVFEDVLVPDGSNNHFYHGKVLLFRTESHDYALYGSSNCTQSALVRTVADGGNVECDLLVRGNPGDFDGFFSVFSLTGSTDPKSHLLYYDPEEQHNFYFKYGILEKTLTLHLGYYKEPGRATIHYREEPVRWRRSGKEIVVEIEPGDVKDTIPVLNISCGNISEDIPCWFVDKTYLELFRVDTGVNEKLTDTPDFGEGEKYREDYELLLKEMGSCREDYLLKLQGIQPYLSAVQATDDTTADPEDNDEFIVNVTIRDEDYAAYKQYKVMENLRSRVTARYLKGISWFFNADRSKTVPCDTGISVEATETRKRIATTEEKRFARFVKRIVRSITKDQDFFEMVSEDHFVGLVVMVLDVFEKYRNTEGMFREDYIISTRCDLLIKLIRKVQKERPDINALISRMMGILLDNHLLCTDLPTDELGSQYEQKNRSVLLELEKRYIIRNDIKKYLTADQRMGADDTGILMNEACNYIDRLYGYSDLEQIRRKLRKHHGDDCEITVHDSVAYIEIKSTNPASLLRPDTDLLKDLVKYSNNVRLLSRVIIVVENPNPENGNSIWGIKNTIDLNYKKWTQEILRKNGMLQESKAKYLSF